MTEHEKTRQVVGNLLKRIFFISSIIMVVAAAIAAAFYSQRAAISIASGWLIAFIGFFVLVMTVVKSFSGEHMKSLGWAMFGILKLGFLGVVLWLLITRGHVEPVLFMSGFSILVLALIIEGARLKHGNTNAV